MVGPPPVDGLPLGETLQKGRPAVLAQGPPGHGDRVVDLPRVPVEPEHGSAVLQRGDGLRPGRQATAAGDDQIPLPGQRLCRLPLQLPKIRLALAGKDLGNGAALGGLDVLVGVHKPALQPFGQPTAHRGLSAAHHADENDVLHGSYPLKLPSTRNSTASWLSSWSTPSMPGADRSPVKSRKKRYSNPRPGMGRDSIFIRLSP